MNTDKNAIWTISPEVHATYTEDGAALLDINKGMCYSLNAVGARVWVTIEANQGGITLESIVNALETHFNVPQEQLQTDTAELLGKLERMGLVYCNGFSFSSKPGGGN